MFVYNILKFNIEIVFNLWIVVAICVDIDKNTFSNYRDVRLDHLHLEWLLNLNTKVIDGTAEYTFKVTTIQLKEVHLDIYQMTVLHVYYPLVGKVLNWYVESYPAQTILQGDKLVIELGQVYKYGDVFKSRIKSQIGEQTDDLKAPNLFSYCEANNFRSMIPSQDTPSKFTYSATVIILIRNKHLFVT